MKLQNAKRLAFIRERTGRRTARVKRSGHGWMTIVVERYFQIGWNGWNGKKKEGSYGR